MAESLPLLKMSFPSDMKRVKLNFVSEVYPDPLNEISGMAVSEKHNGMLWGHNDSGDLPRLVLFQNPIAAPNTKRFSHLFVQNSSNVDWEDLCLASNGKLYVGDFGDNLKRREQYRIYFFDEPKVDSFIQHVKGNELRFEYKYPQSDGLAGRRIQKDCEAFFEYGNALVLLTKHLATSTSDVFILKDALNVVGDVNMPANFFIRLKGMRGVTAAASWNRGERIAVLTYRSVWVFEPSVVGDPVTMFDNPRCLKISAKQCESICFENKNTLLLTNEQRGICRIQLKRLIKGICQ